MITFNETNHKMDMMTEGGEGRIYSYKGKYVIKVYKKNVDKRKKLEKVKILMSKQLPSNVISPLELVQDTSGKFIGYLMDKIKGEEFKRLSSKKFVISHGITKKDISGMLIKIKETVKQLHSQGIYIGDLNDLNILFNVKTFETHFIDIDSWSVDAFHKCTVANDLFKDPKLVGNEFNSQTDAYAFAVLLYKTITRLHPFGGVIKSNRNINTMDRMENGLSVFAVDDLIIPPMVDSDEFLSSDLKDDLSNIFVDGKRFLIDGNLDDFASHLQYCDDHGDYYYSRYNKCPVCEIGATERMKVVKIGTVGGIPIHLVFSDPDVKIIFNRDTYLDMQGFVVFRNGNKKARFQPDTLYHTNADGNAFYKVTDELVKVRTADDLIEIPKLFKSRVIVKGNSLYYVSKSLKLTKFGLLEESNTYEESITDVSINNIFEVENEKNYFVCNEYDNARIVEISGFNYRLNGNGSMIGYGIHFDPISRRWLFIYEDQSGDFYTHIFDKEKGVVYETDDIRYIGKLSNLCFYNDTIYKPSDGKIIGFSYRKNQYKEFEIPVVNAGTNLIKNGKKFIAINEKEIYEIG